MVDETNANDKAKQERLEAASEETARHEEQRSLGPDDVEHDDEAKGPRVVQTAGYDHGDEVRAADKEKTPSARSAFWANADDGRVHETRRADKSEVRGAFKDYEGRPDIESRASILARENAAPGQFTHEDLEGGSVDNPKNLTAEK